MGYEFEAPVKDPDSTLIHSMDWSDWLDDTEEISGTPQVTSSPNGLTVTSVSEEDGIVTWTVSGGHLGSRYIVTCRVTTTFNRIEDRSVLYVIGQR